ncbi:MAG: sulfatase [Opitutaceae bacterium]
MTERPNIIWVFGDQHRGCATGFAGDPNLHTPNLDRMAAEGTVFRNAVAGTPLCSPFRGSLLTGRYPHQCVPGHEDPLPDGMPTVADAFNAAGYDTAWFGKWHIDGFKEKVGRAAFHTVPRNRRGGFKRWMGYENNLVPFDCWVHGHDGDGTEVDHFRLKGYETDEMTSLLIRYLEEQSVPARVGRDRHPDRQASSPPFFCALSVIPPHNPFIAPEHWMQRHTPGTIQLRPNVPPYDTIRREASRQLAGYYAMIENLDHNLGRIRHALDRLGLFENTILMFFSDHGEMLGSHGQMRKTSVYQNHCKSPSWLGGIPFYETEGLVKPQVLNHPINHVDVAATSLGLCGIEPPAAMQGFNYAPQISWTTSEAARPPDSAYLQYCRPSRFGHCVDRPWRGLITEDGWKYACFENQPWVLFDLNADPFELNNLAYYRSSHRRRGQLQAQLAEWIERVDDTFPLPSTNGNR